MSSHTMDEIDGVVPVNPENLKYYCIIAVNNGNGRKYIVQHGNSIKMLLWRLPQTDSWFATLYDAERYLAENTIKGYSLYIQEHIF